MYRSIAGDHLVEVAEVDLLGEDGLQVPHHSLLVDGPGRRVDGPADVRPEVLHGEGGEGGCQPYLEMGEPGAACSSSATSRLMVRGSEGGLPPNPLSAAFSGEAIAIFLGLGGKEMMCCERVEEDESVSARAV